MWYVPPQHWRWLFWIPAIVASVVAVVLFITVKDTPEECGYKNLFPGEADHADADVRGNLKTVFKQITGNHLVWIIAAAYACTGAVRQSIDQWFPRFFQEVHDLDMTGAKFQWLGFMIPIVASAGSLLSGWISDRFFHSRRAPVAAGIYVIEVFVILAAAQVHSVNWAIFFFVMISFTVNSTHSLLGPAAAMDIGGRKMAGFATGVIDSFQYYGTAIALPITGRLIDKYGWGLWYPTMAGFGFIGGCAMLLVMRKQRLLKAREAVL